MPIDISGLPAQDRDDFQKRLQVYGMNVASVQEPLAVMPAANVTLAYGPNQQSARAPFVVQTTDMSHVKRMIGIEDRVAQNFSATRALPGAISLGMRVAGRTMGLGDAGAPSFHASPGMAMDSVAQTSTVAPEHLNQLDDDDLNNVRLAARAFVRGDSKLVASYSPLFTSVIGQITIPIWAMLTVTVHSGATLSFGPGVNTLVAYQVIIENGGRILSHGHLTVNCTKLVRPSGGAIRPTLVGGLTTAFRPIFN